MSMKQAMLDNFAQPRGLPGRLAGRIMARKPGNVARGRWAVEELSPEPHSRVVELGYGPGVTLAAMAEQLTDGHLIGVDRSDVMQAQASRRNRETIRSGLVELRVGDAQRLDPDLTDLDLIYGINVWQFWDDQAATVADLSDRLTPGGRLALVYMQPPSATTTAAQAGGTLRDQLAAAGLVEVEVKTMDFDPPAVMVCGRCEIPRRRRPTTAATAAGQR